MVQTWQDYSAGTSEPVFPSEIDDHYLRELIRIYRSLEGYCEEALGHQDDLVARICRRPYSGGASHSADGLEPRNGEIAGATSNPDQVGFASFVKRHSPENFRKLVNLARRRVPQNLMNAKARFIHGACSEELDEIEQSEILVQLLQFQMKDVEQRILDHVPASFSETVAKLQFIAILIVDGGEMDTDFFAYQVDECAKVLASLGP